MTLGTLIVVAVLAAIVGTIVYRAIKNRRTGRGASCSGCSACSGCASGDDVSSCGHHAE